MPSTSSVLIVGGSLTGLSMALLLAKRNVPCILVERHSTTSIQYKFRGISPRSMEIYRAAGIEALNIEMDVSDAYKKYFEDTWPKSTQQDKADRRSGNRMTKHSLAIRGD